MSAQIDPPSLLRDVRRGSWLMTMPTEYFRRTRIHINDDGNGDARPRCNWLAFVACCLLLAVVLAAVYIGVGLTLDQLLRAF